MNQRGDRLRNGLRLLLAATLLLPLVAGCRAFRPDFTPSGPVGENGVAVNVAYVQRRQTVQIEGTWSHGTFLSSNIEVKEPDDEVELKGDLDRLDVKRRRGSIGGVSFHLPSKVKFAGTEDQPVEPSQFEPGRFVKAECVFRDDRLELRKLRLRERREGERDQLQGRVEEIDFGRREIRIGGVVATFDPDVPVSWDLATPPTQDVEDVLRRALSGRRVGLPNVRNIDDENRRPTEQLRINDIATVGGELRVDSELRQNHDLKHRTSRDQLTYAGQAKLEVSLRFSDQWFGFVQGRVRHEFVGFDEDRDLEFGTEYKLGETFVYAEDVPLPGLAFQIGRQDFDNGREWVMDELLDAARLYVNLDRALLELSASTILFGAGDQQEGVKNFLLGLHAEPWREQELFAYALHRHGGTLVDLERTHLGVSAEGTSWPFRYWGDVGYATGTEDDVRVQGYGLDVAAMYAPRRVELMPSVYAGYAYGSGDAHPERGSDHNFRQTGLNDNNDKFNGVTSFRYLGELVRPEVSNIRVLTFGTGIRPARKTSIDLVFHHYRQAEAADFLVGSRLRQQPTGDDAYLGREVDLVFGFEDLFPFELEFVAAWFRPGPAFAIRDDAWFGGFKMEWNF